MNSQTVAGNWKQLTGKIRERWSEITDDELGHFEGNVEQLVGMIQQKTGESRESVEQQITALVEETDRAADSAENALQSLNQQAHDYADQAAAAVQQTAEQAADALRDRYHAAEDVVKRKPVEALALTFAAGLVVGIGATLILRSK